MAYTIVKSNGTVLTTIADGTINTTSTSLGLPGRNYAGYGQTLDTNFVHMIENFASTTPPANPLQGQLWYNTNANTLYVCPADGTSNANAWLALTSTASGGTTTFGAVTVTGNLQANNITALNAIVGDTITVRLATVTANATIANAFITSANIGSINPCTLISTGSNTTAGTLQGTWTVTGGLAGNTLIVANGNVYTQGIRTDNYYYANGSPFTPSGTYTNANVFDFMTGSNGVTPTFYTTNTGTANIQVNKLTASQIAGGGTVSGIWTLSSGARWQSTYADLAERFESDNEYDAGTVVEIGGEKEITAVQYDLSEDVFGVVSEKAGYVMNAMAGDDKTHPAIAVGGRVPVKVTGKVKKGQRLVSAGNGIARAAKPGEATAFNTIGRSLINKNTDDVGIVEAFVTIK
jgi:hypothetical protein